MNDMDFPIVTVTTSDGLELCGLLATPQSQYDTIKIHLHGTAGNFYQREFLPLLIRSSLYNDVAFLSTNNRGSGVYEIEAERIPHGASLEKFGDCLKDIDAWIAFALSKGYKRIILEGHSFGTEKILYYMNKGKYKDLVIAVILMGFSDNVGTQQKYEKRIGKHYMAEAQELVNQGKSEYLLADIHGLAGELPISAQTYIDFFSEDSENAKAIPLRNGSNLEFFRNIQVPILGIISDDEEGEYTIIPIQDAINLLKSENTLAEVYQIPGTDHCFIGKEEELDNIISDFTKRRILQ